jgi:phosphate transport system substrate-binding protein
MSPNLMSKFPLSTLFRISFPALALLAMTLPGCGGDEDTSEGPKGGSASSASKVSNDVDVDGSSTVFRISEAAREAFESSGAKANVIVGNHGTGGGFGRYLKGEIDIVDASRAAKPEEEEKAKAQGIDWNRFTVGYDGIAIVVNKKNDFAKSITVNELKKLFASDSKVKTWKDLNSAWPDRKIVLYTPDKDSGTYEFFVEAILGKGGKQRDDIQASADDNFLVRGVAGDADGIGYFGYAYYASNTDTLRTVGVKAKDDAVAIEPTPETILKKTYLPLARPLYIYVKKSSMSRPAVASFVKYYLENVDSIVKKAKYVAPTEEDKGKNKATLDGKAEESKSAAAPEAKPAPAK